MVTNFISILYVLTATLEDCMGKPTENVIFLHGFLSSSLFWTETVFPNLSEPTKRNYRLFAVDLLGFGRSPKPRDCLYTLKDHLEMIDKSVICPFQLNSFHLVAHSMGCIIALALAAKYLNSVQSITLIAPPYFPSSKESASLTALRRLADRRLWPPLLFASSVMSWYEHLGRCVCFIICRNHRTWEWILSLLSGRRDLNFMIIDLTGHTHHSAWHTMHNVICGGAKLMDEYLEALKDSAVSVNVIQGSRDQVVPLECSNNIKMKVPNAEVNIITNADHNTVVVGREMDFTQDLERTWGISC
uniref:AB hydrolase-1 domain-containing protein n=1 Tax=Davidia involucrata TaxID=16924 RepID=A0A5B6YWU1_DAVIN